MRQARCSRQYLRLQERVHVDSYVVQRLVVKATTLSDANGGRTEYKHVRVGVTPFAGGQWASFTARVAGLLALQQLLRPLRFSCAVALTPVVNRLMTALQERFKLKKQTAVGLMFLALALLTTAGYAVALTTVTVINMPKPA
jgi:hypothetical protein